MSRLPRIEPRPAGPAGSLAAQLAEGTVETVSLLRPTRPAGGGGPEPAGTRSGRLAADAFGASTAEARQKLERILAGEGVLVTTGQQPLLFLGPLYVLYKALSAIETAARWEIQTGRPALASFWIASDDHDWAEIAGSRLIDTTNELRELRIEPPAERAGRSVGPSALPEATTALIDEISQSIPASEFTDDYLTLLRTTYRPGARFADAFADCLAGVLDGFDFAWVDAAADSVKQATAPLLRNVLEEAAAWDAALAEGSGRVREAGHEPSIPRLDGATLMFFETEAGRERIYLEGTQARLGRDGPQLSLEELLSRLESRPDRFSPNVALRPALEAWLYPVGAAVLGPSEIAYWAQLPELFEQAGCALPSVRLRGAWTLVETKIQKVLDRLEIDAEGLSDRGQDALRRTVREARPEAVERALHALESELAGGLETLQTALTAELPGLRPSAEKAGAQLSRALSQLETRIDAALRERESVLMEQIRKAALHLFPTGRPQERVQSPFYFLTRYGPDLVEELATRTREGLGAEVPG